MTIYCDKCGAQHDCTGCPVCHGFGKTAPITDELRANDNAISLQAAYESGRASRDAETESLRKDAERYRWLRKNHNADLLAEDIIDEAIDAAMQEDRK